MKAERSADFPVSAKAQTQRFGHGTSRDPNKPTVLARAREVGIAGVVEAQQLALVAMVAGFDRLLVTTPAASHPVIYGAFGKSVELARAVLND